MRSRLVTASICFACWSWWVSAPAHGQETLTLENPHLGLCFDRSTGELVVIQNKLTGETYGVRGEEFAVETTEYGLSSSQLKPVAVDLNGTKLSARYEGETLQVEVGWTLDHDRHFAEKRMTLTLSRNCGLKNVIVGRPTFVAEDLRIVPYRYPTFERQPGTEPSCTFFGRTAKGGLFTGVEIPFDSSTVAGKQVVLAYAPSLKVAAGEKLVCEPAYFGVYRRGPREEEEHDVPLPSESEAMLAMISSILGPPRFGLVPMACGWHCEMEQRMYTEDSFTSDLRSLEFLAECGIDWLSDSHPWGGETDQMNALGPNDSYAPGPLVSKFLEHAQQVGVHVVMWSSMNKTHAWSDQGRPFRPDQPDWLIDAGASPPSGAPEWRRNIQGVLSAGGNCLAHRPFFDWLLRIHLEGMAAGQYKAWAMDGDFFGGGGWYTTVVPVDCQSDKHDHMAGDSDYACQHALAELTDAIRQRFPRTYIFMCRPPMDLGVWSLKNVDACFTLLESGTGKDNLAAGDHIRTWSRVRVHHDFFPHYLDQPLLFPSRAAAAGQPSTWPSGHLDYILLSALSSSPNQLFYLPTKTGIPDSDKAELRRWLDWGRRNIDFLLVRKDLPDWPAAGKVDGSAHMVGDQGLIFLFNSHDKPLWGEFALTDESIGLKSEATFTIAQEHPGPSRVHTARTGEMIYWEVPARTAVVLRIQKADAK